MEAHFIHGIYKIGNLCIEPMVCQYIYCINQCPGIGIRHTDTSYVNEVLQRPFNVDFD